MRVDIRESSCILARRKKKAGMRFFCFPYAGGGASAFRQWSKGLPERIEVCAVQPPGRENRISEPPIADVHELVARLLPAMAFLFDRPFVFYGHSTGALVAFELIRELRRQQMPLPARLIVSAARPPHIPEPYPLHHLPEGEFIRELRRFSGTPDKILENKELMDIYLPILRADFALEETYTFKEEPPINVPVSAFYGTMDNEAPKEVMAMWEQHTALEFTLVQMTGDHFFIRTQKDRFLSAVSRLL